MDRIKLTINTDGSCIGNPGPGGYAAIYHLNGEEHIVKGRAYKTTNNQMELIAVIKAIESLTVPADITIRCDSTYVFMDREKWEKWRLKRDFANKALWEKLIRVGNRGKHKITYVHVDGHSGDDLNERCDKIAKEQARTAMHEAYERGLLNA